MGAVVEKPELTAGDHRVPSVAVLDGHRGRAAASPRRARSSCRPSGSARPSSRRRRRSCPRRPPAARSRARQVQLSAQRGASVTGSSNVRRRRMAQLTVEVLHRERPVAEHDERVVRPRARKLPRGEHVEGRREPMTPAAEDDVKRAVGVGGDPAGPERAAIQLRRTCQRLERRGIDPFDPAGTRVPLRPPAERVAQHEHLPGRAQDDHRRGERIACGGEAEPPAVGESEAADAARRLLAPRASVLRRPRARPQPGPSAAHAAGALQAISRESASAAARCRGPRDSPGSLIISRNAARDGYSATSTRSHSP